MTEADRAKISAHRANLMRYRELLAGELTEAERDFVQRRIVEERGALARLVGAATTTGLPA